MKELVEFVATYPLWVKLSIIALATIIVLLLVIFRPPPKPNSGAGRIAPPPASDSRTAEGQPSPVTVGNVGELSHSVLGSSNVTLHETRLGPLTQVIIENLQVPDAISRQESREGQTLAFLTEQAINYKSYLSGLALSFSLRNEHDENILIYSLVMTLRGFFDSSTIEFRTLVEQLTPPMPFMSAPIPVHGAQVQISPRERTCTVRWGVWDDSAGSRGAALATLDRTQFEKMLSFIKTASAAAQDRVDDGVELLQPSMRFSQAPHETDSFHLDVTGTEEGIYIFDLSATYHVGKQKLTVASDQQYLFITADTNRMRLDRGRLPIR
jgi:hypothetical protein